MCLTDDANSYLSSPLWNDTSRSAVVLVNMVGRVNEGMCVC